MANFKGTSSGLSKGIGINAALPAKYSIKPVQKSYTPAPPIPIGGYNPAQVALKAKMGKPNNSGNALT